MVMCSRTTRSGTANLIQPAIPKSPIVALCATMNAVAPTYLWTDLVRPLFDNESFKDYILNKIPLGRLVNPEEVVGSVVFLASQASSMVTGHVLNVDGGWLAL